MYAPSLTSTGTFDLARSSRSGRAPARPEGARPFGRLDSPRSEPAALLVGFPQREAEVALAILSATGWDRVLTDTGATLPQIIENEQVTLVAIDVDHCDDYAPRLIAMLRATLDPGIKTRIVALAMVLPAGLFQQLQDAGADRVLHKRGENMSGDWAATLA